MHTSEINQTHILPSVSFRVSSCPLFSVIVRWSCTCTSVGIGMQVVRALIWCWCMWVCMYAHTYLWCWDMHVFMMLRYARIYDVEVSLAFNPVHTHFQRVKHLPCTVCRQYTHSPQWMFQKTNITYNATHIRRVKRQWSAVCHQGTPYPDTVPL